MQIGDERGHGHGYPLGERRFLHGFEILEHVVDAAGWREIAACHFRHEFLQDSRVRAAARERARNQRAIDAMAFREAQRFGHCKKMIRTKYLINQLDRLSGT